MAEGDYGIQLPVVVSGVTFDASDSLLFTFKYAMNQSNMLTKEYTNIEQNTVNLEFTEEESAIFTVGTYCYRLDWYENGNFMCNLIPKAVFKVVDKA